MCIRDRPRAVVSLVHGFGEHCGRYEELAAELVASRIAVVGVDLRGHGKTVGPRGVVQTYRHLHEDLKTLLQQTATFYPEFRTSYLGTRWVADWFCITG